MGVRGKAPSTFDRFVRQDSCWRQIPEGLAFILRNCPGVMPLHHLGGIAHVIRHQGDAVLEVFEVGRKAVGEAVLNPFARRPRPVTLAASARASSSAPPAIATADAPRHFRHTVNLERPLPRDPPTVLSSTLWSRHNPLATWKEPPGEEFSASKSAASSRA